MALLERTVPAVSPDARRPGARGADALRRLASRFRALSADRLRIPAPAGASPAEACPRGPRGERRARRGVEPAGRLRRDAGPLAPPPRRSYPPPPDALAHGRGGGAHGAGRDGDDLGDPTEPSLGQAGERRVRARARPDRGPPRKAPRPDRDPDADEHDRAGPARGTAA